MITLVILLEGVADMAGARRAFADAIHSPGDNLDALHDTLCAIGTDTTLIVRTGQPGAFMAMFISRLRAMCEDAARENDRLTFVWAE